MGDVMTHNSRTVTIDHAIQVKSSLLNTRLQLKAELIHTLAATVHAPHHVTCTWRSKI